MEKGEREPAAPFVLWGRIPADAKRDANHRGAPKKSPAKAQRRQVRKTIFLKTLLCLSRPSTMLRTCFVEIFRNPITLPPRTPSFLAVCSCRCRHRDLLDSKR